MADRWSKSLFDVKLTNVKNPFYYPERNALWFERHISSTTDIYGNLWCTIRGEADGKTQLVVFEYGSSGETKRYHIENSGKGSVRPVICAGNDNKIYVVWAEFHLNKWSVICAVKDNGKSDFVSFKVFESQSLVCNPALCWFNNMLWVSWCGYNNENKRLDIFLSTFKDGKTVAPIKLISGDHNSFRPSLTASDDCIFAACDIYRNGRYEIAYLFINDTEDISKLNVLGRDERRWMCPSAACDMSGNFHLVFTEIKDVIDPEYDIVDHDIGAVYAVVNKDGITFFPDKNTGDDYLAARLREGLLAKKVYWGYFGLRRKIQPVVLQNGKVFILWEFTYEQDMSKNEEKETVGEFFSEYHYGWLSGKQLNGTIWSKAKILHEGGTLYSIPAKQGLNKIALTYIDQSDIARVPDICALYVTDEKCNGEKTNEWDRWKAFAKPKVSEKRFSIETDNKFYTLFWADTHTHSNLSPDAEGEPDEIISFAKDIAGLDAMAIVDNDYYPNKALSDGEWRMHQELSGIFTEHGRFVVFPGYEYTYHDEHLNPNFNHRYVLYPESGGEIHRRIDEGSETVGELALSVNKTNGLLFAHHPSWELSGEECDRLVEVCSSWRVCIEEKDFIIKRLKAGERFAFIGSSDTHRAVPGLGGALTGIYATELTPRALFDAYRKRRTIVTQGLKMLIDFRVSGIFIGGEGCIDKAPEIRLRVECEKELEFVELIRDGNAAFRWEPGGRSFSAVFSDNSAERGRHFYFVRVKAVGSPSFNETNGDPSDYKPFVSDRGIYRHNLARARGPFAWSSPVWITLL